VGTALVQIRTNSEISGLVRPAGDSAGLLSDWPADDGVRIGWVDAGRLLDFMRAVPRQGG
jgi:hypothetical protein